MRGHRNHRAWWAFLGHRLSGLVMAAFLPFHFLALGLAVEAAALDEFLVWTDFILVKIAEWGLVTALALHLFFGLRLLVLELSSWPGHSPRLGWILPGLGVSVLIGLVFIAGVI